MLTAEDLAGGVGRSLSEVTLRGGSATVRGEAEGQTWNYTAEGQQSAAPEQLVDAKAEGQQK